MPLVSPSILAADFSKLPEILKETELAGADSIHLDIMDGIFVPNLTFGPVIVKAIRKLTSLPLYAHLMIIRPLRFINEFAKAGVSRIIIHVESDDPVARTLDSIKNMGIEAGITLNPDTAVEVIEPYLNSVDSVLVMSVNPGFSGQKFMPVALEKIKFLSKYRKDSGLKYVISIDGGINDETGKMALKAGADELVASSYVYNGEITNRIKRLKEL